MEVNSSTGVIQEKSVLSFSATISSLEKKIESVATTIFKIQIVQCCAFTVFGLASTINYYSLTSPIPSKITFVGLVSFIILGIMTIPLNDQKKSLLKERGDIIRSSRTTLLNGFIDEWNKKKTTLDALASYINSNSEKLNEIYSSERHDSSFEKLIFFKSDLFQSLDRNNNSYFSEDLKTAFSHYLDVLYETTTPRDFQDNQKDFNQIILNHLSRCLKIINTKIKCIEAFKPCLISDHMVTASYATSRSISKDLQPSQCKWEDFFSKNIDLTTGMIYSK